MKNFILSSIGASFMATLALIDFVILISTFSVASKHLGGTLEAHVVHVILGIVILIFVKFTKRDGELWADTINYTFGFWSKTLILSMIPGIVHALYTVKNEPLWSVIVAGALFGIYATFPCIAAAKALKIVLYRPC